MWRLLAALGALTFLVNGVQVLGDPDCESVTWGGRGGRFKTLTMTCWDAPPAEVDDAWSPTAAGLASIGAGLGLLGLAAWPLIAALVRDEVDVPIDPTMFSTRPGTGPGDESDAPRTPTAASSDTVGRTENPQGSRVGVMSPTRPETGAVGGGLANVLDVLDDSTVAAIVRFRAPVADVVGAAADLHPRDLAPELAYAVLATSTMWWKSWQDEVGPDPTPVQGRTTAARRAVMHACHFGLALGALLAHGSTAPVTSGGAEDTNRAMDLGLTWYRQVMGVSTSGLLDRSPVFAAATDVCLDVVADGLDEAPELSDEQLELLLAVCRHAVTDGAFLAITARPSSTT